MKNIEASKVVKAVADSFSIAGAVRMLGKKPSGAHRHRLTIRVKQMGLDTSHFDPFRKLKMKWTDDQIKDAVLNASCMRDVVRLLGSNISSGATFAHIKKRVLACGADTSHFNGRTNTTNYGVKYCKRTWKDILVLDRNQGARERSNILLRALQEFGRDVDHCGKCGIGEWNGEKLRIEAHHKNGNRCDNRDENINLLCPNCHSQTPNYGNKKRI